MRPAFDELWTPFLLKQRRKSTRRTSSFKSHVAEVTIDHLGAQGDGIGFDDQGQKYVVPYGGVGDHLRLKTYKKTSDGFFARIEDILTEGPDRIHAPCAHFSKCGGCALQHIKASAYQDFKLSRLKQHLKRAHVDYPEIDPVFIGPQTRRRVRFGLLKKGRKIVFGFHEKASNRLVEIDSCLILVPGLEQLIDPLRQLLPDIIKREGMGSLSLTHGDQGIDLLIEFPGWPSQACQDQLISFAQSHSIDRISWQAEPKEGPQLIAGFKPVRVSFGDVPVHLPLASFLQPSLEGEQAMASFVKGAFGDEKKVLDLYAGCGSFTFELARNRNVHAVEIHEPALKALSEAAGRTGLGGRITTEGRDLDRQPLSPKELEKFQAVLFDPPRAGARAQSDALSKSKIATIVAISCNPQTFARDAAILCEGGYRIEKLMLFDQFTWSSHLELGAVFRK